MEERLLYIVANMNCSHGGAVVNRRNYNLLQDIYKERLYVYEFDYDFHQTMAGKMANMFRGMLYGITPRHVADVLRLIEREHITRVFVAYSLFSCFVVAIKKKYPQIEVITFFHNVEYEYALDEAKVEKGVKYRLLTVLAKKFESLSVKLSDKLVALNKRDAEQIRQLYGRTIDLILPTTFKDRASGLKDLEKGSVGKPLRLLFVGFNFYANAHGVDWFVKNVMPKVPDAVLYVVGKDMENERERWESENVVVVGTVGNLDEWYLKADVVVLPIFLGSGMKTKTAEALMYGKPILGTSEAFEGYDFDISLVGALCNDARAFVERINEMKNDGEWMKEKGRNSRRLFETDYIYETSLDKMRSFLGQ